MQEVYLLQFEFAVTQEVSGLHFYQGVYWSAVLREFLRKFIPATLEQRDFLDKLGIYPLCVPKGLKSYLAGDKIHFNLILPTEHREMLLKAMRNIVTNKYHDLSFPSHSRFFPGKNVRLNGIKCLISHESNPERWQALNSAFVLQETRHLQEFKELTLVFFSPLRMSRAVKSKDRPWIDPRYWDSHYFLQRLSESLAAGISESELMQVETINRGFCWIDVYDGGSPLAGMCGAVQLRLPASEKLYRMLVEGQYTGIGKNRSLGLGFYYLAESSQNPLIKLPENAATLLHKASEPRLLSLLLDNLDSDSAGLDNLTTHDLKQNRDEYLKVLHDCLAEGKYLPGETKKVCLHSPEGKERWIEIRSIRERHLLQAIASTLYDAIDEQIPYSVYAYRKGKGYLDAVKAVQNGFGKGFFSALVSDIAAYFDSIDPEILWLQLLGLFGPDPILNIINIVVKLRDQGIEQGNPLSPLLSNIHLLPLDRELGRTGKHYVRYADDFVLMDKEQADPDKLIATISKTLDLLNLHLSTDKTSIFTNGDEITFLGCRLNSNSMVKLADLNKEEPRNEETGTAEKDENTLLLPDFEKGIPVYLTYQEAAVRCSDTELLIEVGENVRHVSWKIINRIVVIGKPRISVNAIYRALSLNKPVIFLSIMGKPIGAFYPHQRTISPKEMYNDSENPFSVFETSFIRSIVMAKLNNQSLVLKKNGIELKELTSFRDKCLTLTDADALRGMEGAGAAAYWKSFANLVAPFGFSSRQYHPSPDPINALLSLGYIILYYRMTEALIAAGLSPWDGIFHQKHHSHYALASDMIEPFRFLVDRIVLAIIHTDQLKPENFTISEGKQGKYCRLDQDGFRKFINRFELTMHDEVQDEDGTKRTWAEILDFACRQLVNSLRIGISYHPYLLKK